MLLLLLKAGEIEFALRAKDVVEVVPTIPLDAVETARHPACIGTFVYHGEYVPVVDLCAFWFGRRCDRKLSTRVVLVGDASRAGRPGLGLVAEAATETVRVDPGKTSLFDVDAQTAPQLIRGAKDCDYRVLNTTAFIKFFSPR